MAGMRIHTAVAVVHQGGIHGRFWLPGDIRMVSSVKVIGVAIWGSGWWLILTHNIGLFRHHIPY